MTGMIAVATLEFQVSISSILIYTWYIVCVCVYILYFYIYLLSVLTFNFYNMTVCGGVDEIQVKIARGVLAQGQI